MSTIRINTTGINQIRQFLADNHKLGGDHFDDAMLSAWAADVERNYSEQGEAEFEIRGMYSVTGNPVICRLSSDGYDRTDRDEAIMLLGGVRGYMIPRIIWSQSETGTLANRDVNMDAADDWIDDLPDDAVITIDAADTGEAQSIAAEADRAACIGSSYAEYTDWVRVVVDIPARGCTAGIVAHLYIPEGGW